MKNQLLLKNVKKKYKDFQLDISMNLPVGQITGLIGLNGAGKSTTFKAILGLIKLDEGSVKIFEKEKLTNFEKEQIGVVLAESGFSGYLTVKQISAICKGLYKKFNEKAFLEQCERFKLPLNKMTKEFSTGMKAKLKVLVALSHDAKLLILDEPTSGLDIIAREEILNLLREYMENEENSILISSHISSDLEGFCDDIYVLHDGKVIFHDDTDRVIDEYGLLKTSKDQYEKIDKKYILYTKKENYGYSCLTKEKQYYLDNYPEIVIEKGNIDDLLMIMEKGEKH